MRSNPSVVTGAEAIAREQARRVLEDEEATADYEIGLLDLPEAVARHLDRRLHRLRGYESGPGAVELIGATDEPR